MEECVVHGHAKCEVGVSVRIERAASRQCDASCPGFERATPEKLGCQGDQYLRNASEQLWSRLVDIERAFRRGVGEDVASHVLGQERERLLGPAGVKQVSSRQSSM